MSYITAQGHFLVLFMTLRRFLPTLQSYWLFEVRCVRNVLAVLLHVTTAVKLRDSELATAGTMQILSSEMLRTHLVVL
jgi:hypothetical protein